MLVCLGDLFLDMLVWRDAGASGPRLAARPGGSAANTAAWLAHLGVATGFIGAAGTDLVGDLLLDDLHRRGIACAVARLGDQPSGLMLIEVEADGQTRPSSQRGANNHLSLEDEGRRMLRAARWLHLTAYAFYAEAMRAQVLEAIALARAGGARVSLDLGARHLVQRIGVPSYLTLIRAAAPDLLLANETEAAMLGDPHDEPLAILTALAPLAVLKRGAHGCVARQGNNRYEARAPAAAVVDTVGAGDALNAGVIAALDAGRTLPEALAQGVILGARAVSREGGRPPIGEAAHG